MGDSRLAKLDEAVTASLAASLRVADRPGDHVCGRADREARALAAGDGPGWHARGRQQDDAARRGRTSRRGTITGDKDPGPFRAMGIPYQAPK